MRCLEAKEGGLARSLMEAAAPVAAAAPSRVSQAFLTVQHRSHAAISDWASLSLYAGRLTASPDAAGRLLSGLPGVTATDATGAPLVLLDTRPGGVGAEVLPGCGEAPDGAGSLRNAGEAELVAAHVTSLLSAGVAAELIAVISPYTAQVSLLRVRGCGGGGGERGASCRLVAVSDEGED